LLLWLGLILLFALAVLLSLSLGAPVRLSDLWSHDSAAAGVAHTIFLELRPARILAAILVGASLAASGASLQTVFRNPLAEPYLLGISAGGALGAAIALALQRTVTLPLLPATAITPPLALDLTAILAFAGALGATWTVYVLGRRSSKSAVAGWGASLDRSHLLLCGVALSSFLAALMALVVALSNRADIAQQVVFWMMGGLANVRPEQNGVLFLALVLGIGLLLSSARDLNALRLGDEEALSLGVDVAKVHRRLLIAASLMSAAAVSAAGLIGFIGLLAPHIVRTIFGDDARSLVPASALGGATLLVVCDAIARSALNPVELPVGIVTALLGVPLFVFLAQKRI
jgi:iron complex transport system permease protein